MSQDMNPYVSALYGYRFPKEMLHEGYMCLMYSALINTHWYYFMDKEKFSERVIDLSDLPKNSIWLDCNVLSFRLLQLSLIAHVAFVCLSVKRLDQSRQNFIYNMQLCPGLNAK